MEGGPKPFWGSFKYNDIREPEVVRSKGQSGAGSSNREAGPDSPQSERGKSDGGGTIDGELASPCSDVVVEGGEGGDKGVQQDADDKEMEECGDALSSHGSDVMDPTDVRDIGQGGDGGDGGAIPSDRNELLRGDPHPDPMEWSETIAGNRVFQAVCWTNTHNNYLSTEELQNLIDEDPKELRRILRVGDRRKRSEGYTMFLRAHGVLVRTFRGYPHWCLLGVGPIQMTLRQTEHLQHVMSAESKGPYLSGLSNLQSVGPSVLPGGILPTVFLQQTAEFLQDVQEQISCRRCDLFVRLGGWTYVRLESVASPFLYPGVTPEVGLAFQCECGAVHVGETLPRRRDRGTVWSLEDAVVEMLGHACPVRETGCVGARRASREGLGLGLGVGAYAKSPPPPCDRSGGEAMGESNGSFSEALETPAAGGVVGPVWGLADGDSTRCSAGGVRTRSGGSGPSSRGGTDSTLSQSRNERNYRSPSPAEAGAINHRGVSVSVAGLLRMCGHIHRVDVGCPGPLINAVLSKPRSDYDAFSAGCRECGAIFGHVPVSKPNVKSVALGVLLAGGNVDQYVNCNALSDWQAPSKRTLYRYLTEISVAVDVVFSREMKKHREGLKQEPGRGVIRVPIEKHYFAHNETRLKELAKEQGPIKEGHISNTTWTDIAVGLLRSMEDRGEEPGYKVEGDVVVVTPLEVAFDGSYRNRNHTAHSINVVCSLKLREQNNRGLRDAVFGMVTFGRHVGKSLQIDPVCVTSRQGRCPVHGDAQDFKERAHPPATASASVREAAQRLRNSNCYSGTCLTSPHSAPGTESVGVQVLLLTQLLEGWLPTMFAHDQDVGLGLLVRQVTNDAWECLDRSHVQKNLVKAIVKFLPGFAPRVSRNFAYCVAASRKEEEKCEDGSTSRAEAFVEGFAHLVFHLKGNHQYCSPECSGAEKIVALEEPRKTIAPQPDIFDIPALREGGGVAAEELGEGVGVAAAGAAVEGDTTGTRVVAATANLFATHGGGAGGPGASKKSGKKTARACVGSSFTAASLNQTLDDVVKLAAALRKLWRRTLIAIHAFREGGGASDGRPEGLTKKERKAKVVPLTTVRGEWKPPADAEEDSPYDGPARLVVVPALQPCGTCDSHVAFSVACIRAPAFMPDLGTQFLESVNGSIAAKATKRCDFPVTHYPRAQIAVMNRTLPGGAEEVANLIREEMALPRLTPPAAKVISDNDVKNTRLNARGDSMTGDEKKQRTDDKYATRADKSHLIAVWKGISSKDAANNEIDPSGFGLVDVGSVRETLDAISGDKEPEKAPAHVDPSGFGLVDVGSVRETLDAISGDKEPEKAPAHGGEAKEGGAIGGKGKGSKKKGTKRKSATDVMLEHTAAGSNTEKNANVLSDVRMGAGKTKGTCAACRAAGVGLEFLARKSHSRKGAAKCDAIREEWAQANAQS
ncbi:unnamed protein product [Ectocarpus sp. CCAP 1310/34]|nr:unnamed protein product [Ectocarpus sp. CCAP 1310/34]